MSRERWIIVKDDCTIIMHEENDGREFMENGPEFTNEVVTLNELRLRYSRHHFEDALKQLSELGKK